MLISELIQLLEEHRQKYGDLEVKIRDHKSGSRYRVDYVTLWKKEKECQIGIKQDTKEDD